MYHGMVCMYKYVSFPCSTGVCRPGGPRTVRCTSEVVRDVTHRVVVLVSARCEFIKANYLQGGNDHVVSARRIESCMPTQMKKSKRIHGCDLYLLGRYVSAVLLVMAMQVR